MSIDNYQNDCWACKSGGLRSPKWIFRRSAVARWTYRLALLLVFQALLYFHHGVARSKAASACYVTGVELFVDGGFAQV